MTHIDFSSSRSRRPGSARRGGLRIAGRLALAGLILGVIAIQLENGVAGRLTGFTSAAALVDEGDAGKTGAATAL